MSYHDKNNEKTLKESGGDIIAYKDAGRCFDATELTRSQAESMPLADHCWSICNIEDCNGNWIAPPAPWIAGQPYGPFAFQSNILNPPWTGTWTAQSPEFDAFYAWCVGIVGTLNVGDTIRFDMTNTGGMCNILGQCAQIICFKYEGYLNWTNGFGWSITNGAVPTITLDNCCPQSSPSSPPFDCSDCEVVVIDGGSNLVFAHPTLGTSITISHPEIPSSGGELAKLGDTIWIKEAQGGTWSWAGDTGSYSYHLKEFTIDSSCSLTHVRNIPIPYMSGGGPGMCATTLMQGNSIQLITGSVNFNYQYLSNFGPTQGTTYWDLWGTDGLSGNFAMVGIPPLSTPPGTPAHVAPLFNTPGYEVAGDLVYVPSSDTIVASMNYAGGGNVNVIVHYDSNGTVLGTATNAAVQNTPFTMFSYEDDVYVNTQSGTYYYDASTLLTPAALSLSAMSISPYDGYNDGASSPNCTVASPCTEDDMYTASGAQGQPGGLYDVYYNMGTAVPAYFNFTTNFWNNYTGFGGNLSGCDYLWERWTHWTDQIATGTITNPTQLTLKSAKISFVEQMIVNCGCPPQNIALDSLGNTNSYDCVGNNRCVLVGETEIGQFTSLSACQDNCGDGGWNCQTLAGYQSCYQVDLPIIGAYATLLDCQAGFINGGLGPCKAIEPWGDKEEAPPERFKLPPKRLHKNKKY
jgi:hypothetical protein